MVVTLQVNNDDLTEKEIYAILPKMQKEVDMVFDNCCLQSVGFCGQYTFSVESSRRVKLPALMRKLSTNTNGKRPLEIREFYIDRWYENCYPYHEIVR